MGRVSHGFSSQLRELVTSSRGIAVALESEVRNLCELGVGERPRGSPVAQVGGAGDQRGPPKTWSRGASAWQRLQRGRRPRWVASPAGVRTRYSQSPAVTS